MSKKKNLHWRNTTRNYTVYDIVLQTASTNLETIFHLLHTAYKLKGVKEMYYFWYSHFLMTERLNFKKYGYVMLYI